MAVRMQQRRGTAAEWTTANPVLGPGEIGFEIDTNQFKIGDGVAQWEDLAYFQNSDTLGGSIDDYIPLTQRAAANGVATLDGNGQVPASQLAYVDQAVQDVIGLAPEDLNTLVELADAIGDDPDFIGTINADIAAAQSAAQSYTDEALNLYAQKDGVTFTGPVILDADPTQPLEAATKAYVDGVASSLHIHESVAAATTSNIINIATGNSLTSIDGVTLIASPGIRVLVKDQTNSSENGIYVVIREDGVSTFTRAADYDSPAEIDAGDFVFVSGGTSNGNTGWVQTATIGTIGTDPVSFTQFSGAGTYLAGNGLELNGNIFEADFDVTASRAYADGVALLERGNAVSAAQTYTDNAISDLSTTLSADIDEVSTDLSALSSDVTTLSTNVGNQITGLEGDISQIVLDVSANTSDIASLTTDLGTLQGTVTTATGDISTIETTLDAAVLDISTIETTVSNNETTLNGLVTTVDGHTSDITTLLGLSDDVTDLQTDKAPLASPTFTGTVILPATTSIGDVSDAEIAHLNGVTSGIQGQIDAKLDSGVASTTYAPISNPIFTGTVGLPSETSIGSISSTEISYLSGTTSNIQDQLDEKAPSNAPTLNSPTFTGTPTGLTPGMVGLGNVDNTADIDKPVSTATQAALDLKADLAGATFSGNVIVDGDFTVNGTNFSASATSITIEDNLLQLAHQNAANTVDLGLVVGYNDGSTKHSGIVRDVSDSKWKLFKGVSTEPTTTVAFGEGSLDDLELNNLTAAGVVFSDGTQTKQGVPSITTIQQKTSSYQLSDLNDRDTIIEMNSSSAVDLIIRGDTVQGYPNFPVGTTIDIIQTGTGQVTIAAGDGVTINATPGLKLRAQWSSATLLKRAANTWLVYGDLTV